MRWRALAATVVVAVSGSIVFIATGDLRARGDPLPACERAESIEFDCHVRRYTTIVRQDGSRAALTALATDQRRNGYVRAGCHQLTHRIGRAAGDLDGIAALRAGTAVCASGYYHGVLQSVMGRLGRRRAIAQAGAICATVRAAKRRSALHYNCVHGMGHGFMEVSRSDVFRSLSGCEALRNGWERDECSGGVFMENVSAIDNPTRPSRDLRPRRPLYPCDRLARRFWEQCYDWQITYALYVNDGDFAKVFALCTARVASARGPCYRGLGGDALQHSKFVTDLRGRRETIRRLCELGPDRRAREDCVEGAVRTMYRDYVDGDVQARAFCRSLVGSPLRATCVRANQRGRSHVPLPERDAG